MYRAVGVMVMYDVPHPVLHNVPEGYAVGVMVMYDVPLMVLPHPVLHNVPNPNYL